MTSACAGPTPAPDDSCFTPQDMARFAECLTGDSRRDRACFETLLTTVGELCRETDLERLKVKLVDAAVRTTGTERGMLLLLDAGKLRVHVARDRNGSNLPADLDMSRGIPEQVLAQDEPVLARVSGAGEVLKLTHSVASMRLRQVMCAPVRAQGRTMGVLYVDSTLAGMPFTAADLMLFGAQTSLMGMAIEHHRLFRETLEARAMREQLQLARDIQRRLLPESPLTFAGMNLAGSSEPSDRVGGDYFDYFQVGMHRVGISLGDVSGHGIGPALIMSNVRAHVRSLLLIRRSLGGLYGLMNRALCADLTNGMFVSLFVAVYDSSKRLLEYQNAGQTSPLLYDPKRDLFREIPANAPALGILDEISAGPCPALHVEPGEFLVCYTDGVSERHNRDDLLFGEERLKQAVRDAIRGGSGPAEVVQAAKQACEAFAAGLPPRDDITLAVARF